MKVWKIAIKLEIPVLAETAETAMQCAEQIPWADLGNEERDIFSMGQIDHVNKLPLGVDADYIVWVADDSKKFECAEMDVDSALLTETRVKMGLLEWQPK